MQSLLCSVVTAELLIACLHASFTFDGRLERPTDLLTDGTGRVRSRRDDVKAVLALIASSYS